jgi:hypothetical protein
LRTSKPRRAEREVLWAWLQHAYQEGEQPATREQPYRFALLAAMKGDRGKELSRETLRKARAYLAAIERRAEAMKVARTTFGI